MDMNLEMLKDIFSGGWPRNQREQARFDAEHWAINEIESLTQELASAMDEGFNMGSDYFSNQIKTLTAERDALKSSIEAANNQAMYYGQECDRLRAALELIIKVCEPSPVLVYQKMESIANEALKGLA